ncbi:MAG TPA: Hsp20/alpha crystallin family protein [Methylocystis sp.]|nr:Hsp20/alpha crystallin family protein [Methylocystis sp.]
MDHDPLHSWMWSEACAMLARADRLQQAFFKPLPPGSRPPAWEPPIDVLETKAELLVFVALPGVSAESVEVSAIGGELAFAGVRDFPIELQSATIHRLEMPHGRFERRLRLPPGRYGLVRYEIANGCLLIAIEKKGDIA